MADQKKPGKEGARHSLFLEVIPVDDNTFDIKLTAKVRDGQALASKRVVFSVGGAQLPGSEITDATGVANRRASVAGMNGKIMVRAEVEDNGYKEVPFDVGAKPTSGPAKVRLQIEDNVRSTGERILDILVFDAVTGRSVEAKIKITPSEPVLFNGVLLPRPGHLFFIRTVPVSGLVFAVENQNDCELDIQVVSYDAKFQLKLPKSRLKRITAEPDSPALVRLFDGCN